MDIYKAAYEIISDIVTESDDMKVAFNQLEGVIELADKLLEDNKNNSDLFFKRYIL